MSRLLLFVLVSGLSFGVFAAQRPSIVPQWSGATVGEWTMDHSAALSQAKAERKWSLMLFTGSWWCPWCQPLEAKVLNSELWKDYAKDFYEIEMDYPSRNGQGFCWLYDETYRTEAGLSVEEAQAAICEHFAVQDSYAARDAGTATTLATNGCPAVTYRKIGYPTMLVIRPDGTEAGRFTLDYVGGENLKPEEALDTEAGFAATTNRIALIMQADAADAADDEPGSATKLSSATDAESVTPVHTLATPAVVYLSGDNDYCDRDWFRFSVSKSQLDKTFYFQLLKAEGLPVGAIVLELYKDTDEDPVKTTTLTPGTTSDTLAFKPPAKGTWYACLRGAKAGVGLIGYRLSLAARIPAPGALSFAKTYAKTVPLLKEGEPFVFSISRTGGSDGVVNAKISVTEDGVSLGTVTNVVWGHGDAETKQFSWTPPSAEGVQADFPGVIKMSPKGGATAGKVCVVNYTRRDELVEKSFEEYNAEEFGGKASQSGVFWFYGKTTRESAESVFRSAPLTGKSKLSLKLEGPAVLTFDGAVSNAASGVLALDGHTLKSKVDAFAGKVAIPEGEHVVSFSSSKQDGAFMTLSCRSKSMSGWKLKPELPLKGTAVLSSTNLTLSADMPKTLTGAGVALTVDVCGGKSSKSLASLPVTGNPALREDGYEFPENEADAAAFKKVLDGFAGSDFYWRMDTVFTDVFGNRAVQKGSTSKFLVGSAKGAAPDLSGNLPDGWEVEDAGASVIVPFQTIGVSVDLRIPVVGVQSGYTPQVAVKNGKLPDGFKASVSAKKGLVLSGIPTTATTKAATFDLFLTSVKGSKTVQGASVRVTVPEVKKLGGVATTYNGYRSDEVSQDALRGSAKLTVSSKGKISGSFVRDGLTYKYEAKAFSAREEDTFYLKEVVASSGEKTVTADIVVDIEDFARVSDAQIVCSDGQYALFRNRWKKTEQAKAELAKLVGYYTAALPVESSDPTGSALGTGYLTLTVKDDATVAYAGVDSIGKAFSGSSLLLRQLEDFGGTPATEPWTYAFYIDAKPSGSSKSGSGLWGLVTLTLDEWDNQERVYLSTDGSKLTLVNLTPKSVQGYTAWENVLSVVGGTYRTSKPFLRTDAIQWKLESELAAFSNYGGTIGTSSYELDSAPEGTLLFAYTSQKAAFLLNAWNMEMTTFDYKKGLFACDFDFIYSNGSKTKRKAAQARGVLVQYSETGESFWSGLYTLAEKGSYVKKGEDVSYDVNTAFPFKLVPVIDETLDPE